MKTFSKSNKYSKKMLIHKEVLAKNKKKLAPCCLSQLGLINNDGNSNEGSIYVLTHNGIPLALQKEKDNQGLRASSQLRQRSHEKIIEISTKSSENKQVHNVDISTAQSLCPSTIPLIIVSSLLQCLFPGSSVLIAHSIVESLFTMDSGSSAGHSRLCFCHKRCH